jgi:hypothetical protein
MQLFFHPKPQVSQLFSFLKKLQVSNCPWIQTKNFYVI